VRLLAAMSEAGTVTDPAGAARRDRLLLTLTFAAGSVDALSFLGLSRVFTANMTGNAVLLGLAISQTQELQVAHSSAAIVGFVLGVIVGARLVPPSRERIMWSRRMSTAVGVECALLLVFAFGWWLSGPGAAGAGLAVLIVLAGLAMGIQSAIARRLAVPGVSTTFVTGTITALLTELTAVSGAAGDRRRMAAAIGALVAGAVVGGLAQAYARPAAAFVPVVVLVAAVVAVRGFRGAA
jgi:uncharacterized membrane protein YoaK (UPF0700 family)